VPVGLPAVPVSIPGTVIAAMLLPLLTAAGAVCCCCRCFVQTAALGVMRILPAQGGATSSDNKASVYHSVTQDSIVGTALAEVHCTDTPLSSIRSVLPNR
jgi:hypothetical protein